LSRKTLLLFCLVAVATAGALILERQRQRREVFRLVVTILPQTAQIRNFASDGWLVFGKSGAYWVVDCGASGAAVPAGASIADELERKYMLEEFGRQFSGGTVPEGNERVWVMDSPDGEIAICLSSDAKLMWVWRQGR
jgi:hypothetical protein